MTNKLPKNEKSIKIYKTYEKNERRRLVTLTLSDQLEDDPAMIVEKS
jgi:hypothetical protein